ncbi:I78 family peptidase inhibitor [Fodinicurvata sp. EGI_FJ10296]|jgi:hypothetical protein|uniref:I78 family peptidase inhibitor n=1 Tax=Fodinicurvata sp. EGI_FJ10296 TaxID=3231908 RepID=UPI003451218D
MTAFAKQGSDRMCQVELFDSANWWRRAAVFIGSSILIVGCSSAPIDPPMAAPTGEAQLSCGAQIVDWAIGERDTPTVRARLMAESTAQTIRLLNAETTGSMDHRPTRLNIRVGPNNTIRRLSCG